MSQDGRDVYAVVVRASPEDKTLLFEVRGVRSEQDEVLLHASARLVNKELAQIRLWHTEQGRRIEDGEISVRLDKADLLNTKLYLRPGLDRELQFAAKKAQKALAGGRSSSAFAGAWRSLSDSHAAMHDDMYAQARPLLNHWAKHRDSLSADVGPVLEEAIDIVSLYFEIVRELFLATVDAVEASLDQIADTLPSDSAKNAYYQTKAAFSDIPGTFSTLAKPFADGVRGLFSALAQLGDSASQMKDNVARQLNTAAMKKQMKEIYDEVKEYPVVKQLVQWILQIQEKAPAMEMKAVKDSIKDYYRKAGQAAKVSHSFYLRSLGLRGMYPFLFAHCCLALQNGKDAMTSWWQEWEGTIVEYELGRALVSAVKEAAASVQETYGYIAPEDRIDDAFRWIRSQFHAYKDEQMGWQRYVPRVVKSDPEEGQYELEIPLPMKARSLEHVAQAFHPDSFTAIRNQMSDQLGQLSDTVTGALGSIPPPSNAGAVEDKFRDVLHTVQGYQATQLGKSWPFESKALLVGDEHFVTFDGRVFSFKADCEYLLAHDFVDQRFTIHASFGKRNGKVELQTLHLRAQGHDLTLHRNGALDVDGQRKELPWQKLDDVTGSVQLRAERLDHSAILRTKDGIKLHCDAYYHKCSVSLPGHYHGKSAGLLGSNDNEEGNDFRLPNGDQAKDAQELAQGWHVGQGRCASAASVAAPRGAEEAECREWFAARSSPFAACFRHVNPRPFLAICESGVPACNSSAAYTTICRWKGIKLDMPSKCVRCDTPTAEQLTDGQDIRVESDQAPSDSADIVFVVQETPCNQPRQAHLAKLGSGMAKALEKKGIRNVRFGVVGFGGEGVHSKAHFHSGSGAINFDHQGLVKAAATLDFQVSPQSGHGMQTELSWAVSNQ